MRRLLIAAATLGLVAMMAGSVWAQNTTSPGAAGAPANTANAAATAGDYESPMRPQCENELRRDAKWKAELKQQLASEIHEEDARLMLVNKRHVVMSYGALWVLVLGFVVFMWIRQRGLQSEIARLEQEIERAAADD